MKKTILTALLIAAITPAFAGVKKIGTVNGIDLYRVKTASLFCPATTTILAADPNQPGTFSVINAAAGPGVVPAAANAGGLVGAAALLRPARSETSVNASGSSSAATEGGTSAVNGHVPPPSIPGWTPPGHR